MKKNLTKTALLAIFLGVALFTKAEQSYRIEVAYTQPYQASSEWRNTYFDGGKIGGTVDFHLPLNMTIQTGLSYSLSYGYNKQHWSTNTTAGIEFVENKIMAHSIDIPIRYTYTQKIWSKLAVFGYIGPNVQIGVAYTQNALSNLSEQKAQWLREEFGLNIFTGKTDLYQNGTLRRLNLQLGAGGGIQWDKYRIQGGYDWGMFSVSKQYNIHQKGWYAGFSYTF